MTTVSALIAVGANLVGADGATPLQACERAVRAVADLAGVRSVVRGRWYSSAPVPPSAQPRYVNGCLRVACALSPEALLDALQLTERRAGRVRGVRDAARPLDLDIVDMAGVVRRDERLVLPHPRAHVRAFVLRPLRDVAPCWSHPVSGLSVQTLLDGLPVQDVEPV